MGVKWTVHREVDKQPLYSVTMCYYYRGPVRERRERERDTLSGDRRKQHILLRAMEDYGNKYSPTTWWTLKLDPGSVIPGCGWGWSGGEDQSPCSRDNASVSPPTTESWIKWDIIALLTRYSRLLFPKEPLPQVTSGWDSALVPMHQARHQ